MGVLEAVIAVWLAGTPGAPDGRSKPDLSSKLLYKLVGDAKKAAADQSRKGQYAEAADGLEKFIAQTEETYGAPAIATATLRDSDENLKSEKKAAELYRTRGALAVTAASDKESATRLLFLLTEGNSLIESATLADPRAQVLLDQLRNLDPSAKALFAPRKLKVVVVSSLKDTVNAKYAEDAVAQLKLLGLAASTVNGDEEFQVELSEGKVVDASNSLYAAGNDSLKTAISCELVARAAWRAKGKLELTALDLGKRGVGFSDIPGSCLNPLLRASAQLIPLKILHAWAAR